ncbi:Uncharacterised protein [Niallia circulans]|jgi:hypothetical protein|nr:paeninodin family lasso peptide [Niallia circulans]MCM2983542.1 paeninodin family lasso peptide [Niallia circulans]MDR4317690.1 paeninodin family lasso peptide [Niallia circulans]MED3841176.1 paeninodin family lasso peptide [Niallia circulans]MED4245753.1 paeninodin family lasso peptide [Niallia circulans]MED4247665.1 paeninodin family lasso peptide [Niallia circulans]
MNKLEWKEPNLEVLDVKETMAGPFNNNKLDATYETGTPFPDLGWS